MDDKYSQMTTISQTVDEDTNAKTATTTSANDERIVRHNTTTDRFLQLTTKGLDADDECVHLLLQLHAHAVVLFRLHAQLVESALKLPVVGRQLPATALFDLQLGLQVSQLKTANNRVNRRSLLIDTSQHSTVYFDA